MSYSLPPEGGDASLFGSYGAAGGSYGSMFSPPTFNSGLGEGTSAADTGGDGGAAQASRKGAGASKKKGNGAGRNTKEGEDSIGMDRESKEDKDIKKRSSKACDACRKAKCVLTRAVSMRFSVVWRVMQLLMLSTLTSFFLN